jgi:transposase
LRFPLRFGTTEGMDEQDQTIAELKRQIAALLQRIQQLEDEVARLKKNSGNSSKPPSSDIVKPPKEPHHHGTQRNPGAQPGHRKCTRQPFGPDQVDTVIEYELNESNAQGWEPLDRWSVIQQVTLPPKRYGVTEHRARCYRNPITGTIRIAPFPEEVRKGGLLGADLTALIAFFKGAGHLSYTTIQQVFDQMLHLPLSRGLLSKAVQKVSAALAPATDQLVRQLPKEEKLGIDETGHHDNGDLHWTWCFTAPRYSVFKIDKSRGSGVLEAVLGTDFAGLIEADYWGAYRKYARLFGVRMQYCLAHLIREIRFLTEQKNRSLSRWAQTLLADLRKLFVTLHRRDKMTAKGWRRSMEKIRDALLRRVRRPPDHAMARKLAKRFAGTAARDYFRFIEEPQVEPTNNGTERQIRPVVIDRRITQGTRGQTGMRWCERIWSILATCRKQQRNVLDFIHQSIRAHWTRKPHPHLL